MSEAPLKSWLAWNKVEPVIQGDPDLHAALKQVILMAESFVALKDGFNGDDNMSANIVDFACTGRPGKESESDVEQSESDVKQSENNMEQSENDVEQSENDVEESEGNEEENESDKEENKGDEEENKGNKEESENDKEESENDEEEREKKATQAMYQPEDSQPWADSVIAVRRQSSPNYPPIPDPQS
ncbi:hypothetical protein BC835DRAFT_1420885 [Cytidiella melzeri]|nr:hypothetical protein BC835DRAFT_1420885 [Cytidiella melzeri]